MPKRKGPPGFEWDQRLNNGIGAYRNLRTGQVAGEAQINATLRSVVNAAEGRMAELGRMVAEGDITTGQFYRFMRQDLRHVTNANAALAKGGWGRMTASDWLANGRQLRTEYQNAERFAQDVAARLDTDNPMSAEQAAARAASYANTTYRRYWEIVDERAKAAGSTQKRLVTVGDTKVCEICIEIEGRGWLPMGVEFAAQGYAADVPPIHPACRCDVEYQ